MPNKSSQRTDIAKSYRFDRETVELIKKLTKAMRDPETGQSRSATDIIRLGVRVLARKHLPKPNGKQS